MKKVFVILLMIIIYNLPATEKEDLFFIKALIQNKHFDMAWDECNQFKKKYPQSTLTDEITLNMAFIQMEKKNHHYADLLVNSINQRNLKPSQEAQWLLLNITNTWYSINEENTSALQVGNSEHTQLIKFSETDLLINANEFIQKFPNHPEISQIYFILGDIQLRKNNNKQAENYYNQGKNHNAKIQGNIKLLNLYLKNNQKNTADTLYQSIMADSLSKDEKNYTITLYIHYYEQQKDWQSIYTILDNYFKTQVIPPFQKLNNQEEFLAYQYANALIEINKPEKAVDFLNHIPGETDKSKYFKALAFIKLHQFAEGLDILNQLIENSQDSDIKSISLFQSIQIMSQNDINQAVEKLNDYLIKYPNQKWVGDIHYQIAFNLYKNRNYIDALSHANQALEFGSGHPSQSQNQKDFEEKALFLKCEALFFLNKKQETIEIATHFRNQFAHSALMDEVIFKLALSLYQSSQQDSAAFFFKEITEKYPESSKKGMSLYYLGENELSKNHYNRAKTFFEQALQGNTDQGVLYLRLSYIEYALKNYQKAKEIIVNVPDEPDYLFDKNLLRGIIAFAEKSFTDALNFFMKAEKNVPDQVSLEHLWSRQAWTLYRLKRYDEATKIYKQLSEQSTAPGKYTLAAASAAYNAENYLQSLELYQQYLSEHPQSKEVYKALSGIANSQFNLANYPDAISTWEKMVDIQYPSSIIESAVQGIQWSYRQQNNKKEFIKWINEKIRKSTDKNLKITLYEYKIRFEYDQEEYSASISSIQQLFKQYPEMEKEEKFQILLANNYIWLKQFENADRIYVQLVVKNNDPQIFHEWGNIKWAQQDTLGAMKRYKKAADASKQENFWLVLLEKQMVANDKDFDKYYQTFMSFANSYYQELAKLILIDKYIKDNQFDNAIETINSLEKSDNPLIRVKTLFSKAVISFNKKDYDNAMKDFFRIRYVFTEYSDLRWNSEYYICKIFIEKGEVDQAKELFNQIKEKIKLEQSNELQSIITGGR
ncbi:MAG TPA: tetratricopeptide repeat protein [Candidatus Cloacimonadota bacterium]|nr:tetratricopeptide repeat protein [Candidatus Cloacimonadota bacterium]HPM01027.1 tetratricopeptide repeat protein [Candidatus Cloacimonadota bacterium]